MDNAFIGILGIIAIGAMIIVAAEWRRRHLIPLSTKRRRIIKLDLGAVREKITKRHKWDSAKAQAMEDEYRDFLILLAENEGKTISPWSDDLDLFWHEHILNTRKYAEDCKYIFGRRIEHDPLIDKRPSHHMETRNVTIALREAQLKARQERQQAVKAAGGHHATASDGFDIATWGCSSGTTSSHSHSHGHSPGSSDIGHSDGGSHSSGHSCGGHSDGGGHSCGGHSCGGHGCGGH